MAHIKMPADIDPTLFQLTDEEISNPFPILADLCKSYRLRDLQEALTGITNIILMQPGAFENPTDRAEFSRMMQKIGKVLEADYLIAINNLHMPVLSEKHIL